MKDLQTCYMEHSRTIRKDTDIKHLIAKKTKRQRTSNPLVTLPKTVCLLSSQGVGTVVMKNCKTICEINRKIKTPYSNERKGRMLLFSAVQEAKKISQR